MTCSSFAFFIILDLYLKSLPTEIYPSSSYACFCSSFVLLSRFFQGKSKGRWFGVLPRTTSIAMGIFAVAVVGSMGKGAEAVPDAESRPGDEEHIDCRERYYKKCT